MKIRNFFGSGKITQRINISVLKGHTDNLRFFFFYYNCFLLINAAIEESEICGFAPGDPATNAPTAQA